MAKKKDSSISFLNRFGYNVVKLPRTGIEPLDVIGKDTVTQWLGALSSVWTSTTLTPVPGPPRLASNINGQKTDSLDLTIGLSVLANALTAFGANATSLDLAYKGASTVQFAYSNVTVTLVSPLDAGNYLASGNLQSKNPVVRKYFENPKCQAYLITSVLKSDSITVAATDSHGGNVAVDVPSLSGLVGASVKVAPAHSSNSSITFTGPEPVTFGFVVQQITFSGGEWSLNDAAPSSALSFSTGGSEESATSDQGIIFEDTDGECRVDLLIEEVAGS